MSDENISINSKDVFWIKDKEYTSRESGYAYRNNKLYLVGYKYKCVPTCLINNEECDKQNCNDCNVVRQHQKRL